MSRPLSALLAALLVWGAATSGVYAQVGPRLTSSTPFPVSIVSPEGALATDVNPAALGDVPRWALRVERVQATDDRLLFERRTGGYMALSTRYGLGLGVGFEGVESNRRTGAHRTLTWAASLASGPSWSLGGAWRLRFPDGAQDTVHTADLALAFRPSPVLGFSLLGRDLARRGVRIGGAELARTGVLAAQVRPFGDDRAWLELAAALRQGGDLSLRAAAGAHIPYVGGVSVAAERQEEEGRQLWMLTGGLRLQWGRASAQLAYYATDDDLADGGYAVAGEWTGRPRPGLPTPRYVAEVPIRGASPRGVLNLVLALERALRDPRVQGVVLRPDSSGAGLVAAQELRALVEQLRAAGKPVYCYLETPSGAEYYLCAGADRLAMDPAGNIQLMGLTARTVLLGDLLRKVGLRADFVRIGRFKSAPEQYTNRRSSEPAREQREALLDDAYQHLVADLARDRGQGEAQVRALIDRGPFVSEEAVQGKLVAAVLDRADMKDDLKELYGGRTRTRPLSAASIPTRYGPTGQIGVVVVDGAIVNGKNQDIPVIGVHTSGGHTVVDAIDALAANPRVRAIVVRVDSPGGAVLASDQIWRALRRAKKKKPVVASMGNVAASGGYYVASAASEIFALPATITGSIGIFYGKVDVQPLAEKLEIGLEQIERGKRAGADSIYRPFTDDERAELVKKLRFWYQQFLQRVAEGRGMKAAEVDALARGRVYSGLRAKKVGLVDHLGGFAAALARARELGGLSEDAGLVVLPQRPSSLLGYLLRAGDGASAEGPVQEVDGSTWPLLQRLSWLRLLDGTQPLALWEAQLVVE